MITHGFYARTRHKHKLKKTFIMLSAGLGLFFMLIRIHLQMVKIILNWVRIQNC